MRGPRPERGKRCGEQEHAEKERNDGVAEADAHDFGVGLDAEDGDEEQDEERRDCERDGFAHPQHDGKREDGEARFALDCEFDVVTDGGRRRQQVHDEHEGDCDKDVDVGARHGLRRRRETLELFEPVEHDFDLRRHRLGVVDDDEESLTVRGHVEGGNIGTLEEHA